MEATRGPSLHDDQIDTNSNVNLSSLYTLRERGITVQGEELAKIRSANEPVTVDNTCLLIFGDPGIGKSTLAATAEGPLLLDFDGNFHRAGFRCDWVAAPRWADAELSKEEAEKYKTIVVDTGGTALDRLTTEIIAGDSKLGTRDGQLQMRGWGVLKLRFQAWLKRLQSFGLDVVILAHSKEQQQGDDMLWRPDIQGGSLGVVFRAADAVGFYRYDEGRKIEFSPSNAWLAKDPAGLGRVAVSSPLEPNALAEIIRSIKASIEGQSRESQRVAAAVDAFFSRIEESSEASGLNEILGDMAKESDAVRVQVRSLLIKRAKLLEVKFDKVSKKFADPESN